MAPRDSDEPCDPRELGPATAPGLSRKEQAERTARLVMQYKAADWTASEIAAQLDLHPDSVTRIVREQERKAKRCAAP